MLECLSLILVVVGASLATIGDIHSTRNGVIGAILSALLAAVKAMTTHTAIKDLGTLQLLHLISGPACLYSLLAAYEFGEIDSLMAANSRGLGAHVMVMAMG